MTDLKIFISDLADKVMDGIDGPEEQPEEAMEEPSRQRDREQMAAERENSRLNQIMSVIQEPLCVLMEYDDVLARQIIDRVLFCKRINQKI